MAEKYDIASHEEAAQYFNDPDRSPMRTGHIARRCLLCATLSACASAPTRRTVAAADMDPGSTAQSLNARERAEQAVSRLTFGARAGDVAQVERMGLSAWLERQLDPDRIADPVTDSTLALFDITHKSAFELLADHPQPNEFGVTLGTAADSGKFRVLGVMRFTASRELHTSVLIRAVTSERQLQEVMTAFWENHFSVSDQKMPNPFALVDYDRAIRAHALGKFRDLLHVVATSPAMLFYLDNFQSTVDSAHPNPIEWRVEERRRAHPPMGDSALVHAIRRRRTGVNENYARELMELHTLGVDGGYTQRDVQEVARCLTGWGIESPNMGGSFLFQPALHDAGEKTVLGVHMAGGRGLEDGEQVLDLLARHPSTAHFIARKLATHFVSDTPPPALVERLAQVFLRTDGDLRAVMRALVRSPEFNSRAAYRAKVKTPFEFVASVLRVMQAAPDTTQRRVQIVARLGQPIFARTTPDGWPDTGDAWLNTGALLNRVNFGQQVGAGQVGGVSVAKWPVMRELPVANREATVDAIMSLFLGSSAAPATRTVFASVPAPSASGDAAWTRYVGTLVGIAIGAPEFQRR